MPKTSDAMRRAIDKYNKEKVDEIKVRVPKGRKQEIQVHAASLGESLNGYITKAVNERMKREKTQ